jgi:hypothetical protein
VPVIDYIFRNRIPLILVAALHYTLFLWMYFFWMMPTSSEVEFTEVEVQVLDEDELAEIIMDINPEQLPPVLQEMQVENAVANQEADQSTRAENRASDRAMSEDVYDEVKQFEADAYAALQAQWDVDHPDDPYEAPENPNNANDNLEVSETPSNAADGTVTVSYFLKGRYDKNLPIPAYLCQGSGTVVVIVKVNQKGKVTAVRADETKSNMARPCLVEAALDRARKSTFNSDITATNQQEGSITYVFVGQ